jgi:hypothetical protein
MQKATQLISVRMVKNAFKITRITPGVSFKVYWYIQLKYDVEGRVLKK